MALKLPKHILAEPGQWSSTLSTSVENASNDVMELGFKADSRHNGGYGKLEDFGTDCAETRSSPQQGPGVVLVNG